MLAARNGDHAQARKLIEKINGYRLTIFFGLITLAEESIGKMRRDGITRIYLEMGEYVAARKEIAKKLPGQSISEWLLNNASYSFSVPRTGAKSDNYCIGC